MTASRRSLIVRMVVVVLLLWTAADITNSNLCALEQEQETPASASDSRVTPAPASTAPLPIAPEPAHVDDCFCCSHCVEIQDLAPRLVSEPVSSHLDTLILASPRIFGVRLYHPPLA